MDGSGEESGEGEKRRAEVEDELADVVISCLNFADSLDIDVLKSCQRKIELNETRYPVEKARGSSAKYDEL